MSVGTDVEVPADREVRRLRDLVEISKRINSSLEPAALYESILEVARQQIGVGRGTLYFVDEKRSELWAKISSDPGIDEIRLAIGQGIAGAVAATGEPVLLDDVQTDPRFDRATDRKSGYLTESMLCVPIRNSRGRVVGVLQLLNKQTGRFDAADLEFLDSISDPMAIAIENAALHREAVEKERMERDLLLGREIQKRLLPPPPDDLPGLEIAAVTHFCHEVGGDYYDFLRLSEHELAVAFGDVSGKGVSAALIMTSLQAAIHIAMPREEDLAQLTSQVNTLLYSLTSGRKYVTLVLGRYDLRSGLFRYVNAGHLPALLVGPDRFVRLGPTGRPVGLLPGTTFQVGEACLAPGEQLLLYTDGLTEACDPGEEEFGQQRLEQALAARGPQPPAEIVAGMLDEVERFGRGVPASDDRTVVALRRR